MKYPESTQRSAEYLRMALSLMSKHAAALHPITYAVWYEYAAGNNPGLKQELDNHLNSNSKLDEELTRKLYASYVAELDPQTLERFNEEFRHLLQQVGQAAARTGQDTSKFGLELEQFGQDLGPSLPPDELNRRVERMLREIQNVHASIRGLNERLDESRNEVERLKGELIRAREEAVIDGLSGLLNRKAFDERVEALLQTVNGSGVVGPTVIMIDIDHFKQVNDKYGHLFGDAVIRTIGHLIKSSVKGQDIAARYGGEEFALVLPETPLAGARVVADRLRFAVSQARIRRLNSEEPVGNISISAGVAAHRASDGALELFSRADEALYQSKSGGRNRITVAE
jgi:diguanylate cyclase